MTFDKNRVVAGHGLTLVLWDFSLQKVILKEENAHET